MQGCSKGVWHEKTKIWEWVEHGTFKLANVYKKGKTSWSLRPRSHACDYKTAFRPNPVLQWKTQVFQFICNEARLFLRLPPPKMQLAAATKDVTSSTFGRCSLHHAAAANRVIQRSNMNANTANCTTWRQRLGPVVLIKRGSRSHRTSQVFVKPLDLV